MTKDLKYLNAFNQIDLIGAKKLQEIKKHFGDYKKAWQASSNELRKIGFQKNVLEELKRLRSSIDIDKEMYDLKRYKIGILTPQNQDYPKLLKEIALPPQALYYLGDKKVLSNCCLAIVGSRKHSAYGKKIAQKLTAGLVKEKLTIVSGLALGIDAISQKAAINNQGKTIGVLGSGLTRIYPKTNRGLAKEILSTGGVLVTEFPLKAAPLKHHFPMRNRIISGLSLGTVVIEAAERSGSLITANLALEQGKEVFAVPGNIFSQYSQGTNMLIQQGAKLVRQPKDILEELDI